MKLSIALATYNEEKNIEECLISIKDIADEIVIVDGSSSDKTVEIAKKYTSNILITDNPPIFHINKQKAIDKASGEWILQLDADERVTKALAAEICKVINMPTNELAEYQNNLSGRKLFSRHQQLLEKRDGEIGQKQGEYTAFFIPRLNYFLGRYLRFGGVYPDGVIRLIKKNRAYLPCKNVHEQFVVEGQVGWLQENLLHIDSPTFSRYIQRNNRYVNLLVKEFKEMNLKKDFINFLNYIFYKPLLWFFMTQVRHKGILDGIPGVIFSLFSAIRFSRAYWRYINGK